MKSLLVNTYDKGGAAKACLRLHQALLNSGSESELLLLHQTNNTINNTTVFVPEPIRYSTNQKIRFKIRNILRELKLYQEKEIITEQELFLKNRDKQLELFSFPNSQCDIYSNSAVQETDVINLHWVANFLDYKSFFEKNEKPVVWTLHDQSPFAGGEHYEESHMGINEKGFPIKRVLSDFEIKIHQEIIDFKIDLFSKVKNLNIVCPSTWLAKSAKQSAVFNKFDVHVIPNGIPSSIFQPRALNYSRELFGIDRNTFVILFVADSVKNYRKGFQYLVNAIEKLKLKNTLLVSVGRGDISKITSSNMLHIGEVRDELLMSIIYSMADVFVIPSLMDNLPNTVLESLMCGTPVIGFPIGGIPDMVENDNNGFLCDQISVGSLANTINKFYNNRKDFDSEAIHTHAKKKYDAPIASKKYTELFQNLINNTSA